MFLLVTRPFLIWVCIFLVYFSVRILIFMYLSLKTILKTKYAVSKSCCFATKMVRSLQSKNASGNKVTLTIVLDTVCEFWGGNSYTEESNSQHQNLALQRQYPVSIHILEFELLCLVKAHSLIAVVLLCLWKHCFLVIVVCLNELPTLKDRTVNKLSWSSVVMVHDSVIQLDEIGL